MRPHCPSANSYLRPVHLSQTELARCARELQRAATDGSRRGEEPDGSEKKEVIVDPAISAPTTPTTFPCLPCPQIPATQQTLSPRPVVGNAENAAPAFRHVWTLQACMREPNVSAIPPRATGWPDCRPIVRCPAARDELMLDWGEVCSNESHAFTAEERAYAVSKLNAQTSRTTMTPIRTPDVWVDTKVLAVCPCPNQTPASLCCRSNAETLIPRATCSTSDRGFLGTSVLADRVLQARQKQRKLQFTAPLQASHRHIQTHHMESVPPASHTRSKDRSVYVALSA